MALTSQHVPVASQFDKVLKFAETKGSYRGVTAGNPPLVVTRQQLFEALSNCRISAKHFFPSTKWAKLPPLAEEDYITWQSEEMVWTYYWDPKLFKSPIEYPMGHWDDCAANMGSKDQQSSTMIQTPLPLPRHQQYQETNRESRRLPPLAQLAGEPTVSQQIQHAQPTQPTEKDTDLLLAPIYSKPNDKIHWVKVSMDQQLDIEGKAWDEMLQNAAKQFTEAGWLAWTRRQMADRKIGFLDKPYQEYVAMAIDEPPRPVLPIASDPYQPKDPFTFAK